MERPLAVGDLVMLKSEQVVMTVQGVEDGWIECIWLDPTHRVRCNLFRPATLRQFVLPAEVDPAAPGVDTFKARLQTFVHGVDAVMSDPTLDQAQRVDRVCGLLSAIQADPACAPTPQPGEPR